MVVVADPETKGVQVVAVEPLLLAMRVPMGDEPPLLATVVLVAVEVVQKRTAVRPVLAMVVPMGLVFLLQPQVVLDAVPVL